MPRMNNAADKEVENRRRQLRKWIDSHFPNMAAFVARHGLNQGEISGLLKTKSFGSRKARNLEEAAGMPLRYLEQTDEGSPLGVGVSGDNIAAGPEIRGLVPVISWVQAGAWAEICDNFQPADADEWLPCPVAHGPNTFALKVQGVSMEKKFQDGDIIFVDPSKEAYSGKHVVVRLDDEERATFKQLIIENGEMFLRPLNPDWPEKVIHVNGRATICGVVIGKFVPV